MGLFKRSRSRSQMGKAPVSNPAPNVPPQSGNSQYRPPTGGPPGPPPGIPTGVPTGLPPGGPPPQYGGGPPARASSQMGAYPGQNKPPAPMQPDLGQLFRSVDRDRSGQISSNELQAALSNGSQQAFNPETCRLMIGMFDSNGDGGIDFREFQALWNYVNDWTACFRSFDLDNSGNIDKGELTNALTRFGYRLSNPFYDILMRKFDRSHSGRINFDDFIQLCVVLQTLTASFRDKDTDRDGVVTIGYEEFLTMVAGLVLRLR